MEEEPAGRDSRIIPTSKKNLLAQTLLQWSKAGVVPHGAIQKAATQFGVSRKTAQRIWAEAKLQIQSGVPVNIRGRVKGYEHKDKFQLDAAKVRELSVLERSNIRKLAYKLDVSKSTVGRFVKKQHLRPHTNAIKPILTSSNKVARIRWSLSHIQPLIANGMLKYHPMHNVVHIDEKWFYMTKTSERPHFAENGEVIFYGKIGIFPFTTMEPAKRKSKNRPRGTMETKPIQSVNKEVMRACLIEKIIPAIKAKWPHNVSKEIFIQQDNAKPHIHHNDADFLAVASTDGFKFHIRCQPPQSPDCNVLDLGYFRAIQSLQDDKVAKGVDELLRNVHSSFDELSPYTLNNVFLTLQGCLTEILKVQGCNGYKTPHMNKERLTRMGTLPQALEVEEGVVKAAVAYLQLPEHDVSTNYDISGVTAAVGF
ncbi:uncharacterized protein LOC121744667 [Salvia splendens]|uniref:uncharacterized protein LOC121744667 n=1 Tax=Salvia splendens TaxID=180675 RepID=UPI001C256F91|nr:uncharacterized protein LOC121744667 [Salvia splendens]